MVRSIFIDSRQLQRINPPRRIRRIRLQVQPALIADRVGQAFLSCPVRSFFRHFAPRFVLRRPGYVAVVVG